MSHRSRILALFFLRQVQIVLLRVIGRCMGVRKFAESVKRFLDSAIA